MRNTLKESQNAAKKTDKEPTVKQVHAGGHGGKNAPATGVEKTNPAAKKTYLRRILSVNKLYLLLSIILAVSGAYLITDYVLSPHWLSIQGQEIPVESLLDLSSAKYAKINLPYSNETYDPKFYLINLTATTGPDGTITLYADDCVQKVNIDNATVFHNDTCNKCAHCKGLALKTEPNKTIHMTILIRDNGGKVYFNILNASVKEALRSEVPASKEPNFIITTPKEKISLPMMRPSTSHFYMAESTLLLLSVDPSLQIKFPSDDCLWAVYANGIKTYQNTGCYKSCQDCGGITINMTPYIHYGTNNITWIVEDLGGKILVDSYPTEKSHIWLWAGWLLLIYALIAPKIVGPEDSP
ncbi:Uncharacterised protein [uncultured archaeon]|nr:Uncharacterised protein [uncultured archaeon]